MNSVWCVGALLLLTLLGTTPTRAESDNSRLLKVAEAAAAEAAVKACDTAIDTGVQQIKQLMEERIRGDPRLRAVRLLYPLNVSRCGKENHDQVARLTDRLCASDVDYLVTCSPLAWDGKTNTTEVFDYIVNLRHDAETKGKRCLCSLPDE